MIKASDGSLAAAYEYDAFGQTLRESGTYAASNPFRYSTKYTDIETGLVYYGLRYYSPSLGRFVNRDPIEEAGGINLYAFVGNNGVNGWDYLGMNHPGQSNAAGSNLGPIDQAGLWLGRKIGQGANNFVFLVLYIMPHESVSVTYGPGTREVADMRVSPGAAVMRERFYANGAQTTPDIVYNSPQAWKETLLYPSTADWASTAAQVGGFAGGSVVNNEDGTATYTIPNLAGTKSFFYHLVPDIPKTWDYYGPFAPINQTFNWTEPIDPTRVQQPGHEIVRDENGKEVVRLAPFIVNGTKSTPAENATKTTIPQDWADLQKTLGRRPNIGDWWNREFSGGARGSIRERAAQMMQGTKTPEEAMAEEYQKLMGRQVI